MNVILLERVEKLGQMGDVVSVKPGYARNFLIPQKKALRATNANKAVFEERRIHLEADNLTRKTEAEAVGEKLNGVDVMLIRQAGEAGQLYGSVSARDVATGLIEAGFTVDRNQVDLAKPIKTIGLFDVTVKLHPEVFVTVTANVARSKDEGETQLKTGKAVIGSQDEEENEAVLEAEEVFEEGLEVETDVDDADSEPDAASEPDADETPTS